MGCGASKPPESASVAPTPTEDPGQRAMSENSSQPVPAETPVVKGTSTGVDDQSKPKPLPVDGASAGAAPMKRREAVRYALHVPVGHRGPGRGDQRSMLRAHSRTTCAVSCAVVRTGLDLPCSYHTAFTRAPTRPTHSIYLAPSDAQC